MTSLPLPDTIDVIVHTGDAQWWQIAAAIGPEIMLVVALIIWFALRQRAGKATGAFADEGGPEDGSEWWCRARWALEATLADKPARQEAGLVALELLTASRLSGKEETRIIAEAWNQPLRDGRDLGLVKESSVPDGNLHESINPEEERVIVRASRLRLATDTKLGLQSPSWVREVAKRPL